MPWIAALTEVIVRREIECEVVVALMLLTAIQCQAEKGSLSAMHRLAIEASVNWATRSRSWAARKDCARGIAVSSFSDNGIRRKSRHICVDAWLNTTYAEASDRETGCRADGNDCFRRVFLSVFLNQLRKSLTFCGGKKVAVNRTVTISVPEAHARRIEAVEKEELSVLLHAAVMNWFDDGRRRDIAVKRQGISWQKDVYGALMKHIGTGGISRFVRDAVYEDLSKYEKDLLVIPDWKLGRGNKSSTKKRLSPGDRLAVQAPMVFPEQWIERIEARWPGKVSTYIKAQVQLKLEKKLGIQLPVQRGLADFLGR